MSNLYLAQNEPTTIRAQAGKYEYLTQPFWKKAVWNVAAQVVAPYLPNPNDGRRFWIDVSQFNLLDLILMVVYQPVPLEGVIIRQGGSASVKDTKFEFWWNVAKQIPELLQQIYTYNWIGWSVDLHIQNFMESMELYSGGFLGDGEHLWVDAECDSGKTPREVSNHTYQYGSRLVSETGRKWGCYSAPWFTDIKMEPQDWFDIIMWWIARWNYPTQSQEHPGPVIMPMGVNGRVSEKKCMLQQTGSNGDEKPFGGSGRYDTDRWYGDDAMWKAEFGEITPPDPTSPEERFRIIEEELARQDLVDHELRQQIFVVANSLGQLRDEHNALGKSVGDIEKLIDDLTRLFKQYDEQ